MEQEYIKAYGFRIGMVCMLALLVIAVVMVNRAFIVGALSGIVFLAFSFRKVALNWKTICLTIMLMLTAVGLLALFVKSGSSEGRMLIYKISWHMFIDHPFKGIGWGNFQRDYGLYQATYFRAGNFTQQEFLLAGNTFYAFNDYWELIVETGVIGLAGLGISIGLLVWLVWHSLTTEPENGLLKLVIALGFTIAVAALFTHVFGHKFFKIVLAAVLAYIVVQRKLKFNYRYFSTIAILIVVGIFSIYQYYPDIKNRNGHKQWERAKTLTAIGYVLEAQKLYAALYPSLKNDIGFLKDYNDALTGSSNNGRKLFLLKKIMSRYTDNLSYLKLADLYNELNMQKKAEEAYLIATHMVPNRFVQKEALFNFYIGQGQFEKAAYWQNVILEMPIKIPSERINAIRQNVKNKSIYINTLNKKQ